MLEKMADFFDARLGGYDEHMLNDIAGAREFYPHTASLLPVKKGTKVLDLGCGTGLELEEYFRLNPTASVTGIDMARGMLNALADKFPDKDLTLVNGSYFDIPLGECIYDCAVSVESLHHYTMDEKTVLYEKVYRALKRNGYFILTDYFALSDDEEQMLRDEYLALRAEQGIDDDAFYHFDTPLTEEHEAQTLIEAGFTSVETVAGWGATKILKAVK